MEIAEQLIARRTRELRQERRLTLQQVAARAAISKSFLSKVERATVSISIAALSRLAHALGVPLGEFFASNTPEAEVIYVPRAGWQSVTGGGRAKLPYNYDVLVPSRGRRQMEPIMISMDGRKKAKFQLRQHPDDEFIFVMEGDMGYVCGNQEFTLHPGDCLYFNAQIPHGPKVSRNQKVRYLTVLTTNNHSAPGQLGSPRRRFPIERPGPPIRTKRHRNR